MFYYVFITVAYVRIHVLMYYELFSCTAASVSYKLTYLLTKDVDENRTEQPSTKYNMLYLLQLGTKYM